jgi:hypothetical protein
LTFASFPTWVLYGFEELAVGVAVEFGRGFDLEPVEEPAEGLDGGEFTDDGWGCFLVSGGLGGDGIGGGAGLGLTEWEFRFRFVEDCSNVN